MSYQRDNTERTGLRIIYKLTYRLAKYFKKLSENIFFTLYKMEFGERDDDIYIVAYPKSGTTLVQMILYQLTTDGDMSFNHIYEVSPWIRNAAYKKKSQKVFPSPRIIKSHDFYKDFHKKIKGRFIHIYRNGMDIAVSHYYQNKNYRKNDLMFDEFVTNFLKPRKKSWFNYANAWFKNKNKFPILYIKYEDLISNKEFQIQRIVNFCKIKVDHEIIKRTMKRSSFEYMKSHENKFGEQPSESKMLYDQFIRKGKTGEGKKIFTEEQRAKFNESFNKIVKDQLPNF